jgi:DinB superfamily
MSDLPALLERYRRGPEVLAMVLTGVSGEEEDFVPAPGKWSPRQIVAHLADAELVGAHRMRQVIAEDNPTLIAYDQDAWTRNLDYARRKPKQSLEAFRRIRAENYELLKELPESAFERTGNHSENGSMTLRRLLEGYAEHAESHARQLQQMREDYKKAKGKK